MWFTSIINKILLKNKKDDFEKCYAFVSRWEGGYVNHPKDPGGETNFGISKKSYPHLDIKNLTREHAKDIYRRDYWEASDCDKMGWPCNLIVFDAAVNRGVNRAKKLYDSAVDWPSMIEKRKTSYRRIASRNKSLNVFLKGWLNRIDALEQYIKDNS